MTYRIKEIENGLGEKYYVPQKFDGDGWLALREYARYSIGNTIEVTRTTVGEAKGCIEADKKKDKEKLLREIKFSKVVYED